MHAFKNGRNTTFFYHPASAAPRLHRADDPTIWRVDDALWALLAPILKSEKERKKPGARGATIGRSSTG